MKRFIVSSVDNSTKQWENGCTIVTVKLLGKSRLYVPPSSFCNLMTNPLDHESGMGQRSF